MINSRSLAAILMSDTEITRGFCPGASGIDVKSPPIFPEATDLLSDHDSRQQPSGSNSLFY